jgi:hypothetical protein
MGPPAIADYGPEAIRLSRRQQVVAGKFFDPGLLRRAMEAAIA